MNLSFLTMMKVPVYGMIGSYLGIFLQYPLFYSLGAVFFLSLVLGYFGAPLLLWSFFIVIACVGFYVPLNVCFVLGLILAVLNLPFLRRLLISAPVMWAMNALKFLPKISQTEKTAIEAGTVWMDAELFSGYPNFKRMMGEKYPKLSKDEQAFLDGPCEELCAMVDDWSVHRTRNFTEEAWAFMKAHRFFGMIIPTQYGGLGFSALGNSAVVAKLSSRSSPLGITVMVPNSLGPAELLIHYGTKEQKNYYLPRLADGREVPCFALTEPVAGSDAGAITSHGVVFKGTDGTPWVRLNWKKRYITLAAVSTVLGLAFKLKDPQNILGKGVDLGVTCILVPTQTTGVKLGRRHDPLGTPFFNCPTEGVNVELPVTAIIGGKKGAGRGWKMLMQSLAAGRGISLPANCSGGAKFVMRVVSAYATIRKQFGTSIGKFEGIQDPLAEIVGFNYLMEAGRRYTCGGIDSGAKPAVVTAIAKYHFTELWRKSINHGMDILGGAAISLGPRNLLAHSYFATPIGITVEGANILTRTLIIFGQGAIRCHPFVLKEMQALESKNSKDFDRSFFGHIGHVVRNKTRWFVLSLTRARLVIPYKGGATGRYYQKLSWMSAQFAYFTDLALATMGGNLKRKELITGRFGDVLSWMYLATAILRRFESEGRLKEDEAVMHWSMQYCFYQMQLAFEGLFQNMGFIYRPILFLTRLNAVGRRPSDALSFKIAAQSQIPGAWRDRQTAGIYVPKDAKEALGRYEKALEKIVASTPVSKKIVDALKRGKLRKAAPEVLIADALKMSIITKAEAALIQEAEELRRDAIQVDAFTLAHYKKFSVVGDV